MKQGNASMLRPLLPSRGRVQLRLSRLGPDSGSFSAGQVEALLSDFLRGGSVQTFEIAHHVQQPSHLVLVGTRLSGTDTQGRPLSIGLHLALQLEDGRWVLRELRETGR